MKAVRAKKCVVGVRESAGFNIISDFWGVG
jgi:hypothetical protein